ncbi:hypothetical protein PR048_000042 [Dryococelus australis]|uniref:Uncharacterized protein n=1 Tax=Dryococelus australis TaxID=614101 RepID=A0ABQ9IDJ3_9NEOP|nr:hypothetical protein PR048_000042 [Dryococelus australis]
METGCISTTHNEQVCDVTCRTMSYWWKSKLTSNRVQHRANSSLPHNEQVCDVTCRTMSYWWKSKLTSNRVQHRPNSSLPHNEQEKFGKPFKDKIDFICVYTVVTFAIGSGFIRHALDDYAPTIDLKKKNRIPYCQIWGDTGATANEQTSEVRLYKGLRTYIHTEDELVDRYWPMDATNLKQYDQLMYTLYQYKTVEKRDIPEKTRRATASSGSIRTCENPVTRPGIEPDSPRCEASVLKINKENILTADYRPRLDLSIIDSNDGCDMHAAVCWSWHCTAALRGYPPPLPDNGIFQQDYAPCMSSTPKLSIIRSRSIVESSNDCCVKLVLLIRHPASVYETLREGLFASKMLHLQISGSCVYSYGFFTALGRISHMIGYCVLEIFSVGRPDGWRSSCQALIGKRSSKMLFASDVILLACCSCSSRMQQVTNDKIVGVSRATNSIARGQVLYELAIASRLCMIEHDITNSATCQLQCTRRQNDVTGEQHLGTPFANQRLVIQFASRYLELQGTLRCTQRSSQSDTRPVSTASCSQSENWYPHPMMVMKVSMEQRRNERVGETADPRENPPTSDIVRHDSHMRKSGVTRPGIEPGSPWWETDVKCLTDECSRENSVAYMLPLADLSSSELGRTFHLSSISFAAHDVAEDGCLPTSAAPSPRHANNMSKCRAKSVRNFPSRIAWSRVPGTRDGLSSVPCGSCPMANTRLPAWEAREQFKARQTQRRPMAEGLENFANSFWDLGAAVAERLDCSPPGKADRVTPGFSHVGIAQDDVDGRRVFSGISIGSCDLDARLHSPVYPRASDVCSLAADTESSQCYSTPASMALATCFLATFRRHQLSHYAEIAKAQRSDADLRDNLSSMRLHILCPRCQNAIAFQMCLRNALARMADSPLPEERVDTDCRLVEDQQLWVVHQCYGEGHSPLLTATATHRTLQMSSLHIPETPVYLYLHFLPLRDKGVAVGLSTSRLSLMRAKFSSHVGNLEDLPLDGGFSFVLMSPTPLHSVPVLYSPCGNDNNAHYSKVAVQEMLVEHLDIHFPNHWIGRGDPIAWPPHSPDLWLWGHSKSMVYATPLDTRDELIRRKHLHMCIATCPDGGGQLE